jgi:NDP-sugar pyrophosphorylase family protein
MRAVILAGGRGTRLRPLTDSRPKPLLPFMGEPYAAGLLRRFAGAGVDRVTFLIGVDPAPYAELQHVAMTLRMEVDVATEDEPLDTAGAARQLLRDVDEGPVLVGNGDVLTDLDLVALLAAHDAAGAAATIALTRVGETSSFGVVVCDADGRVRRFVEKPAPGTLPDDTVNAGTYVLSPGVFAGFPGAGPLSFEREVFPGLVDSGALVLGYVSEAHWADLGTPERYLDGTRAVLDGRCAWPAAPGMVAAGVATQVHVDAEVTGSDLGPGVVVGEACEVGAGCVLRDTVLLPHAVLGIEVTADGAIVGEGARIGAGARLGPGTVVGDNVRVPAGAVLP